MALKEGSFQPTVFLVALLSRLCKANLTASKVSTPEPAALSVRPVQRIRSLAIRQSIIEGEVYSAVPSRLYHKKDQLSQSDREEQGSFMCLFPDRHDSISVMIIRDIIKAILMRSEPCGAATRNGQAAPGAMMRHTVERKH